MVKLSPPYHLHSEFSRLRLDITENLILLLTCDIFLIVCVLNLTDFCFGLVVKLLWPGYADSGDIQAIKSQSF